MPDSSFDLKVTQEKKMVLGYSPVIFRPLNCIVLSFLGGNSKAIGCISSECTILKCLEDKGERFEKIHINASNVHHIDEIMIDNNTYLVTVKNKSLSVTSLETSE